MQLDSLLLQFILDPNVFLDPAVFCVHLPLLTAENQFDLNNTHWYTISFTLKDMIYVRWRNTGTLKQAAQSTQKNNERDEIQIFIHLL